MKTPPMAAQRPYSHSQHGDTRDDPWFWLKQRENPDVIAYLDAENRYAEAAMDHTRGLQKQIYDDMLSRIRQTDLSVPYRHGPYEYFQRTVEGKDYSIHLRRTPEDSKSEEVILDVNQLAEGSDYFALGILEVSPDHNWLAWSHDKDGSEHYTLFVRNLVTGETLNQAIPDTEYGFAWATDSRHFFFTTVDHAHRPWRVYRAVAGQPASEACLVFEEPDESFFVDVYRSLSHRFVQISTESKVTSEHLFLNADTPEDDFTMVQQRCAGVEYSVTDQGNRFLITTNLDAPNFRLCEAPLNAPGVANWKTLIPHRDDVTLDGVTAFANFLVIHEQADGLPRIVVEDIERKVRHTLETDEPVYEIYSAVNAEYCTDVWRFCFSSLVTPTCVFEYNMHTRERTLLKQTPVLGEFDSSHYTSERQWINSHDGARVPLSIVRKRDDDRSGPQPMLLLGYGAYGSRYPVNFRSGWLSLMDRGISIGIAHVRGGEEMGRGWYDDGKLDRKANSFRDFAACARYLVDSGVTAPDRFAIMGGSAGGLLIGAVLNQAPELFRAAVAQVPFVDVITTLVDTSLPLSRTEWDEWGDPNDPHMYEAMRKWSPYDNVRAVSYPALLVTGGLNDPRVSYWEPAKWVARLRTVSTGKAPLILKTNMGAGHGGASGRYAQLEETAFEYAFLVDQITAET